MFSIKSRIILIILNLVIGSLFIFTGLMIKGIIFIIGALLLTYGYFRYASIYLAFQYVVKDDLIKAKELIGATPNPNLLNKQNKGFYFFISGIINFHEKDWQSAELNFLKALNYDIRTENNKAIIYGHLAQISVEKGDKSEAKTFLIKAKEVPHRENVRERISKIESQINAMNT